MAPEPIPSTLEDVIKKCQDALFVSHPDIDRANIADTKGTRAPGTCEWVLVNAECQAWLDKKFSLFWISGGPGTGKTVMSLFHSGQVEKRCRDTDDHFLFYFCRFQYESYNKPEKLLRSLTYQLLHFSTDMIKIHEVSTYLDTPEKAKIALSSPECLWKILKILLSQSGLSTIYGIIDRIDECDSSDVLVSKFRDYCTSPTGRNGPLKLALIGRDVDILGKPVQSRSRELSPAATPNTNSVEVDTVDEFQGIKLDSDHQEHINDDIATFTRWSLEPLQRIQGFGAIHSQIQKALLQRAGGTFLWVSLVILELSKKRTCLQISETAQSIPVDLYPIFGRMLHQIDPKYRHVSANIFKWLATAMRPLTLHELASAVGSGIEGMADRIAICQPLLTLDDDRVLFVHQSTREYLHRGQPDADHVAELFQRDQLSAELRSAYELFNYARWKKWVNADDIIAIPLEYAVRGGCEDAVRFLLDHGADVDGGKISASWVAAKRGAGSILQILLEYGAKITKNRLFDRSLLITAAREGFINLVQILLDHGADVNIRNDENETALILAARFAHEDLVMFLLEHGSHFDVADFRVWLRQTARILGSRWSTKVVPTLLNCVADICWGGEDGGRLLNLAPRFADCEMVAVCLTMGADVNWKHSNSRTALVEAVLGCNTLGPKASEIYVKNRPRYAYKKSPGMTVERRSAIVTFLLDHVADINLCAETYDGLLLPPLVATAIQGNT
ncbi:NACHT and Ankyrin domain [Fusarium agapanthi]|uniref:NACHT and Ankyrin domain n=1 Tax=Fusarium agapanthi TaxID=1803897 RepID=A0A9P5BL10_9HYPO|nr:NACHT and Ankyrin domain [Fusarium agapanthi]